MGRREPPAARRRREPPAARRCREPPAARRCREPPAARRRRKEREHVTTSEQTQTQAPTEAVQPSGVNHLVLNVKDLERSHRFWTEIIGFKQVGQSRPESPFQMRFYAGSDGSR